MFCADLSDKYNQYITCFKTQKDLAMSIETNILLETGTNELEFVEFMLSYVDKRGKEIEQSFGINVAKVREIIRMPKLTEMPNLNESVIGVFNFRDNIIPAIDLNRYLYGDKNKADNKKMIIAEFNNLRNGFIVDDVRRIHRISWNSIVSPDTLQEVDPENASIIGIIKFDDRNILMIDIEKIIAEIDPSSAIDNTGKSVKFKGAPKAFTAEDSTTIRNMITSRLKLAGFEINSHNDGAQAWEDLEKISDKIDAGADVHDFLDIIITDIEMPRMDGYSLIKNIKSNPHFKDIPIVIFSSMISDDIKHRGKAVGADAQLTKPQIGELLAVVRALLNVPEDDEQ